MNNQSTFDKLMRAQTFATWSLLWAEVRLPTHVRTRLIGWLILHLYQSSSAYARPLAAACLAPLLLLLIPYITSRPCWALRSWRCRLTTTVFGEGLVLQSLFASGQFWVIKLSRAIFFLLPI